MNPKTMTQKRGRPSSGDSIRQQLLRDIPGSSRRLLLAGVMTAVHEAGDGPPMIFLHGPAGSVTHAMRIIPGLAKGYRVVVPDLPGQGESEIREGSLDATHMVAWLDALISETCASPPVLVGHLIGGAIALHYAIAHGERISRLVLVDTFGLVPFQPSPEMGSAINQFMTDPTQETHHALWELCSFDLGALQEGMGDAWFPFVKYNLNRAQVPSVIQAIAKLMEQVGEPPIPAEALARIKVPTLLVWGRHDRATPVSVAQVASDRYGWPLRIIEDSAVDPVFDQPEEFVRLILG